MARCWNPGWGWLPISTSMIMALGILTTYTIAVLEKHVDAILPTISDTGINHPEMHIFSQVLNVAAVLVIANIILRYKMIHEIAEEEDSAKLKAVSISALVIGVIAGLGLSIVGNFQDNLAAGEHITGALMAFLLGNVYAIVDAVVTRKMYPKYNGLAVVYLRAILSGCGVIAFIISILGCALSPSHPRDKYHWKPDDPGYHYHLMFTFGEWTMGFSFLTYIATYAVEFSRFHLQLNLIMKLQLQRLNTYSEINEDDSYNRYTERSALMTDYYG